MEIFVDEMTIYDESRRYEGFLSFFFSLSFFTLRATLLYNSSFNDYWNDCNFNVFAIINVIV